MIWAPVSMEKLRRSSWKLLAFLPKMVSPVPYSSPPLSPVKPRSFSSPIALVPKEARRRGRSGSFEPTSPKVSCMGRVGRKKKKKKKKKRPEQEQTVRISTPKSLANMLKGRQQHVGKSTDESGPAAAANIPNLGSMKKYSSSRGTLEGFDWKNHGFEMKQKQVGEECEGETAVDVSAGTVIEPRKETSLWKRRSFAPPTMLVLSK